MSADEEARRQLQEMLLDDVEPLPEAVREAMFARTFASPPGAGQDLLPPDGLFDPAPEDAPEEVSGDVTGGTDGAAADGTDGDDGIEPAGDGVAVDELAGDDPSRYGDPHAEDPAAGDEGDHDAGPGDPAAGW